MSEEQASTSIENPVLPMLTAVEARVLGALIEKELTTPDYYPLTLNSLMNACNQKSNRDPVVQFDDRTIVRALDKLGDKHLAQTILGADSRVPKYRHLFRQTLKVNEAETAILCELLLRGQQTVGELKTRGDRMFAFNDLLHTDATLQQLCEREIVVKLPRQSGQKESRYMHTLCGKPEMKEEERHVPAENARLAVLAENERLAALEAEVATLKEQVAAILTEFAEFRKQFE